MPVRMCIACREGKPKKELVRIIAEEGQLRVDETGKAQGRGAYLCPSVDCLDKAKKIKAFNRMLNIQISDKLYNDIKRVILRRELK